MQSIPRFILCFGINAQPIDLQVNQVICLVPKNSASPLVAHINSSISIRYNDCVGRYFHHRAQPLKLKQLLIAQAQDRFHLADCFPNGFVAVVQHESGEAVTSRIFIAGWTSKYHVIVRSTNVIKSFWNIRQLREINTLYGIFDIRGNTRHICRVVGVKKDCNLFSADTQLVLHHLQRFEQVNVGRCDNIDRQATDAAYFALDAACADNRRGTELFCFGRTFC